MIFYNKNLDQSNEFSKQFLYLNTAKQPSVSI